MHSRPRRERVRALQLVTELTCYARHHHQKQLTKVRNRKARFRQRWIGGWRLKLQLLLCLFFPFFFCNELRFCPRQGVGSSGFQQKQGGSLRRLFQFQTRCGWGRSRLGGVCLSPLSLCFSFSFLVPETVCILLDSWGN